MNKKFMALASVCILLVGGAIGGTVAWLTTQTDEVQNVFTAGSIEMELNEKTTGYKMIPGWTIDKDPVVTVKAGSEDCFVFIEVNKSGGNVTVGGKTYSFDDFIAYKIDSRWSVLTDESGKAVEGVYFCRAENIVSDRELNVLSGGTYTDSAGTVTWNAKQVATKASVTKEMMNAVTDSGNPTLTFTAYAVQLYKNNTAEFTPFQAWQLAKAG